MLGGRRLVRRGRWRTDLDLGNAFGGYLRRWPANIGKSLFDLVRGADVMDTAIEVTLPAGVGR
jgi:hypothetical protein